jgi:hypothetical protein
MNPQTQPGAGCEEMQVRPSESRRFLSGPRIPLIFVFSQREILPLLFVLLLLAAPAFAQEKSAAPAPKDETETVITTFRVIQGKEAEFAKVLAKAWPTYHKLGMVLDQPHLILRGEDAPGKTYFVEILTWKSSDEPDNAPPEVSAIWKQMEALCEPRGGHRGIEFPEVWVVNLKE